MDFDQIETFLEVARLSSFSRAAERRFRTQPAISSQIRSLEEEVGAQLLDRSGGRVALTAAGKVFQKYAEETIEQRRVMLITLAEMHRVPRGEIVATLEPLLLHYKEERRPGESFGDYCHRLGPDHARALLPTAAAVS